LIDDAVAILEASITLSKSDYKDGQVHLQQGRLHLYHHFSSLGEKESDYNKKETLFIKASKFVAGMDFEKCTFSNHHSLLIVGYSTEPDRGLKRRLIDDCSSYPNSPYKREKYSSFENVK
jgi:hypothetical protein